MKECEAGGSSLGPFFSEVARWTLGLARPVRHEIESLCLDLLDEHWAWEVGRFPPCSRCGVRGESHEDDVKLCGGCGKQRGIPSLLIALGDYSAGLGSLVAAAKYRGWSMPLEVLGDLLGQEIIAQTPETGVCTVVTPIPSPWFRRFHRGMNHSRVLGEAVSRRTQWAFCGALVRGWEPPQVGATRSARMRGGRRVRIKNGRFAAVLKGKRVILVDDIHTTGATMARASRVCREAGAVETVAAVVATRKNMGSSGVKAQGKTNSGARNDVNSERPPLKGLKTGLLDHPSG